MRRVVALVLLLAACADAPDEVSVAASTTTTETASPSVVALDPAGPYTDGAEVTVTVPHGLAEDWWNGGLRYCTDDACDPTWTPPSYEAITWEEARDTARAVVPAVIFTPDGWRRCDAEVTCRLVVPGTDGTRYASEPLRFDGELLDRPRLEVVGTTVRPSGLEPHPSAMDLDPSMTATVCAFTDAGSACDLLGQRFVTIDVHDPDAPFELSGRREIRGPLDWYDCAAVRCFVQVRRMIVVSYDNGAVLGHDEIVAAEPLRFDPLVPAAPRPSIRVVEDGPFVRGDTVTIVVEHLPAGTDAMLASCDGASPYPRCVYPELVDAVDGVHSLRVSECCAIALMPGQEGAIAIASVPVDVQPPA